MAHLIKLAVVRDILLGHQAEQCALIADGRAVIQRVVHLHGQADRDHHGPSGALLQDAAQAVLGRAQKRLLQEQIPTGVAGQDQFGKDAQGNALLGGLIDLLEHAGGVIGTVGDADAGRSRGDF